MAGQRSRRRRRDRSLQIGRRRQEDGLGGRGSGDIVRGGAVLEYLAVDIGLDQEIKRTAHADGQVHRLRVGVAGARGQDAVVRVRAQQDRVGVQRGIGRHVDRVGPGGAGAGDGDPIAVPVPALAHRRAGAAVGHRPTQVHRLAREVLRRRENAGHRQVRRRAQDNRESAAHEQVVREVCIGHGGQMVKARTVRDHISIPGALGVYRQWHVDGLRVALADVQVTGIVEAEDHRLVVEILVASLAGRVAAAIGRAESRVLREHHPILPDRNRGGRGPHILDHEADRHHGSGEDAVGRRRDAGDGQVRQGFLRDVDRVGRNRRIIPGIGPFVRSLVRIATYHDPDIAERGRQGHWLRERDRRGASSQRSRIIEAGEEDRVGAVAAGRVVDAVAPGPDGGSGPLIHVVPGHEHTRVVVGRRRRGHVLHHQVRQRRQRQSDRLGGANVVTLVGHRLQVFVVGDDIQVIGAGGGLGRHGR